MHSLYYNLLHGMPQVFNAAPFMATALATAPTSSAHAFLITPNFKQTLLPHRLPTAVPRASLQPQPLLPCRTSARLTQHPPARRLA